MSEQEAIKPRKIRPRIPKKIFSRREMYQGELQFRKETDGMSTNQMCDHMLWLCAKQSYAFQTALFKKGMFKEWNSCMSKWLQLFNKLADHESPGTVLSTGDLFKTLEEKSQSVRTQLKLIKNSNDEMSGKQEAPEQAKEAK